MFSPDTTRLIAIGVLVLLAIAPFVVFLRWYRLKTSYPLSIIHIFLVYYIYSRIVWRGEVKGQLPIGDDQGAVIVCNHVSSIDPWFIQLASKRVVHWMVAREYSLHPMLSWIFRAVKAIPVNRGGVDTASTKMAIRYAQQGGLVGLFPEGRINTSDALLMPGRPGAALIALKSRVPVIPCFLSGAPFDGTEYGCFLMTARARLTIGKPIDLSPYYERKDDREVLELLTCRFLQEIASLAGARDFKPQIAGRHWKPGMESAT